ncbi:hypothetical protein [Haloparvum sp. PAK95]|uniref:hypothetical protein n=1 Tax=Haloparvum sp. PAK95 TaxID=3418962 RepID=UPI003D2EAEC4
MSGDADGAAADRESGDAEAVSNADGDAGAAADVDTNDETPTEGTTEPVAGDTGSRPSEGARTRPSASAVAAAGLLATIPVALVALPVAGLLRLAGTTPAGSGIAPAAVLTGIVVGIGGSYAVGPVLVRRSIRNLPDDAGFEAIEDRIVERSTARNLDPPEIRFVDVDAATIAVVDSLSETTIVVPTRIEELDDDAQAAVIEHALTRLETRNAALVTAVLAPALLVEAWTLLGLELARRREEPEEDDRLPQMLGAGDREEREVPWVVFAAAGVLLLVAVVPLWLVFAVGDRLLVGGGRRRADTLVANDSGAGKPGRGGGTGTAGGTGALADALTFARDARGARDWPPTLDRLSLLGMADPVTQRVRGTSRLELRVRLARLRVRENRDGSE